MGYDKIYMLDYFISEEYLSKGLFEAYKLWKQKWDDNLDGYNSLLLEYQGYYNQINFLENEKMPTDPDSEDWTQYGLVPLEEKLAAYNQRLSLMMKVGQGDEEHEDYNTLYLPVYNLAKAVEVQIAVVQAEIDTLRTEQSKIGEQMNNIIEDVQMTNNFTKEQLDELSKFIFEDELSTENYVVTDIMTDAERMDMLNDMLEFSQKELSKVSQPQFQFSADIINLFEIPEFDANSFQFIPGNYVNVTLRDDYIIKARLLSIDVFDFYNPENFSVTFGNMNKTKGKNIYTNITQAISLAKSTSSTVSFGSSNWNRSSKDTSDIGKMIADGLLAAGESLKTSKSDVQIDDRGITISNIPESNYPLDRIFIGNSQILFSDDDFKTIRTGLGRLTYTKKGVTYNDFGLIADFVIAGYIAGSTIEGNEIIGGTITSSNYEKGKEGTFINLIDGTFEFNAFGEPKLTLETVEENGNKSAILTVKGVIKADAGYIGGENGFTIENGKIYSGNKSSFNKQSAGVYIGTDGISLGRKSSTSPYNSPFMVSSAGRITATSGNIAGIEIGETQMFVSAGNGTDQVKFSIGSDGVANFNQEGSHFGGLNFLADGTHLGGIHYGGAGTYGSFNNGFSAGTSFGLDGNALTDFNNLVVDRID